MKKSEPFRQLLAADLALVLDVAAAQDVATALERYWGRRTELETDLGHELVRVAGIGVADLERLEAEVDRLVDDAGGDSGLALSERGGIGASIHSSLGDRLTCTLSGWGAGPRVELRAMATGRYQAPSRVGDGGMGVVYLVYDSELNRRVALKVMRCGAGVARNDPLSASADDTHADRAALARGRSRFLREAWITSTLEHPGVVPIHEVGQTSAGLPYYTMRYVRGEETLQHAIRSAETLEERLALIEPFVRVCDAVRYAHGRGVFHCDLKPANVALGRFGEAIVLDWGLALTRDLPEPVTAAVGTPGYMSPEAAHGSGSGPSEAWDIYGLGATLYEILTGTLPFRFAGFPELCRRLREETPDEAIELDPAIPATLSRLCARALARDPAARPVSVEEIVAGVREWQRASEVDRQTTVLVREADAALSAAEQLDGDALRGELERVATLVERIRTLDPTHPRIDDIAGRGEAARRVALGRHEQVLRRRLLRRVAAFGLVFLTAASAFVTWMFDGERRVAQAERGRAEGLSGFMLEELHDGLQRVERLDLLAPVARRAADYYATTPLVDATPEAARKRALALRGIGGVLVREGDIDAALRSYQDAVGLLRSVRSPTAEVTSELAVCLWYEAHTLLHRGDVDRGLTAAQESLALRRAALADDPESLPRVLAVAGSLEQIAAIRMNRADSDVALKHLVEASRLLDGCKGGGADPTWAELRAALWVRESMLRREQGHLTAAIELAEMAVDARQRRADLDPSDVAALLDLASARSYLGALESQRGRSTSALEHFQAVLGTRRRIAQINPLDQLRRFEFATSLVETAALWARRGDRVRATTELEEALPLLRGLVAVDSENRTWKRGLGIALWRYAQAVGAQQTHADSGKPYEFAQRMAREAVEVHRDLVANDAQNATSCADLALALDTLGSLLRLGGLPEEALEPLAESRTIRQTLVESDEGRARWTRKLADARFTTGWALRDLGRVSEALEEYRSAQNMLRRLTRLDPINAEWKDALARVSVELGDVLRKSGRQEESIPYFEDAARVQSELVAADPQSGSLHEMLARSHAMLGVAHAAKGRLDEAATEFRRAVEEFEVAATLSTGLEPALAWYRKQDRTYSLFAGNREPETTWDHWALAYECFRYRKDYVAAVSHFREVLVDPAYLDPLSTTLYDASRCAALAAGVAERNSAERHVRQALAWLAEDIEFLRARLTLCEAELAQDGLATGRREELEQELRQGRLRLGVAHYRADPAFASIHERPEFRALFHPQPVGETEEVR